MRRPCEVRDNWRARGWSAEGRARFPLCGAKAYRIVEERFWDGEKSGRAYYCAGHYELLAEGLRDAGRAAQVKADEGRHFGPLSLTVEEERHLLELLEAWPDFRNFISDPPVESESYARRFWRRFAEGVGG